MNYKTIFTGRDVSQINKELALAPELWNEHSYRTENPGSPHFGLDDIYVRFNAIENFEGDITLANIPHLSSWYEGAKKLPSVKRFCVWLMAMVEGEILGGVLITRIPPGGRVQPHKDSGFHAGMYSKFLVNLEAAPGQAFIFPDGSLRSEQGDVSCFRNDVSHSVVNNSDHDRVSMIVCLRTEKDYLTGEDQ